MIRGRLKVPKKVFQRKTRRRNRAYPKKIPVDTGAYKKVSNGVRERLDGGSVVQKMSAEGEKGGPPLWGVEQSFLLARPHKTSMPS